MTARLWPAGMRWPPCPTQFRFGGDELARLIEAARQFDEVFSACADGWQAAMGLLQPRRDAVAAALTRCTVDLSQLTRDEQALDAFHHAALWLLG